MFIVNLKLSSGNPSAVNNSRKLHPTQRSTWWSTNIKKLRNKIFSNSTINSSLNRPSRILSKQKLPNPCMSSSVIIGFCWNVYDRRSEVGDKIKHLHTLHLREKSHCRRRNWYTGPPRSIDPRMIKNQDTKPQRRHHQRKRFTVINASLRWKKPFPHSMKIPLMTTRKTPPNEDRQMKNGRSQLVM